MWEIRECRTNESEALDKLLEEGWEPFAVTSESAPRFTEHHIWLRKEVIVPAKPVKKFDTKKD